MAEIPSGPEPRASNSRAASTSSGSMDNQDGRNENCSGVIRFDWVENTTHGST